MVSTARYTPRGPNTLTRIFHDHFDAFSQSYDSLYAKDYGRFRLERIPRVAERFSKGFYNAYAHRQTFRRGRLS